MKTSLLSVSVLSILALAGCSTAQNANQANFTQALDTYLAKRGDLCLAKYNWPIDITHSDVAMGTRDAVQMPVLEKLGLVQSSIVTVAGGPQEKELGIQTMEVKRYELTGAGKKYFLARPPRLLPASTQQRKVGDHDLCAAKLSLDKVIGWEKPAATAKQQETVVTYTYKIQAAPWTQDPAVRKVFPMVDRIIHGAGVLQLKEPMVLTDQGWQAKDL